MNQVRCEETDESKLDSLSSSANCWVSQNECDFTTLGKLTCRFGEPFWLTLENDLRKGSGLQHHAEMRILGLGILRTLHQSRNFCLAEIPQKNALNSTISSSWRQIWRKLRLQLAPQGISIHQTVNHSPCCKVGPQF